MPLDYPPDLGYFTIAVERQRALLAAARALVANAYSDAFMPLFLTASGMMVIGLICALALPNIRLPREGEGRPADAAPQSAEA